MKKDEMAWVYKNCMDTIQQAQLYRGSEERKIQSLKSEVAQNEKEWSTCSSGKIDLEKRLEDVRKIIQTLDVSVDTAIAGVNRSAEKASGQYTAAVRCTAMASASIQAAYQTKGVQDDSDSANTWQLCRKEEARLLNGIEELNNRMAALEATISTLGKKMASAEQNVQVYTNQIRQCEYTASELRRYLGP